MIDEGSAIATAALILIVLGKTLGVTIEGCREGRQPTGILRDCAEECYSLPAYFTAEQRDGCLQFCADAYLKAVKESRK